MACATVRDVQDVESLWSCFDGAFSKDAIAAQLRLHKGSLEHASDALVNMAGFAESLPAPVALPDPLDASRPVVTVNGPTHARARTPHRTVTNAHARAHADARHTRTHTRAQRHKPTRPSLPVQPPEKPPTIATKLPRHPRKAPPTKVTKMSRPQGRVFTIEVKDRENKEDRKSHTERTAITVAVKKRKDKNKRKDKRDKKRGYNTKPRANRGPRQAKRRFRQGKQPLKPRWMLRVFNDAGRTQPTSDVDEAQSDIEASALDRLVERCVETGAATDPGLCFELRRETVRPLFQRAPAS